MPTATARRPALLLLALFALPAAAQPAPGDCALGTAAAVLDVNAVEATVLNTGSLFFGSEVESAYVVPKETGLSPIFAAGLWVGGLVDGELRGAGSRYDNFEFWPGPLGHDARPLDPDDCSAYDRIWTVSRADVARYLVTGEATDDLRDWPADLGAPVLDGDGIPGNYDLAAGDQPAIWGDQAAWWVMNDVGNEHDEWLTPPLGIEVRVTAFAVVGPEVGNAGFPTVDQATFYRYEITNRSGDAIDSTYVSLFTDPDLGNAADDVVGSDTLRHLGYVYNDNNFDSGPTGYGVAPPAVGFGIVESPAATDNGRDDDDDGEVDEPGEELGMTAMIYFIGGGPPGTSDPLNGTENYNVMRGRWTNGFPVVMCGIGINCPGEVTTYAFPGDPTEGTGWNEVSVGNDGGDRRFVVSTGPFRFDPGETETVAFVIAYGRGGSNLRSINVMRAAADQARFFYQEGVLAPTPVSAEEAPELPEEPALPEGLRIARPHPNPFAGPLALRYEVPAPTPLRLSVYDALGREVAVLFDGTAEAGAHEAVLDGGALAPGVYVVRLSVSGGSRALALTRAPARF